MFFPKQEGEKEQRISIGKVSSSINNRQKPLVMMSRHYVEHTECISPFHPYNNPKRSGFHGLHFIDDRNEAQRGSVICLRSHSQ